MKLICLTGIDGAGKTTLAKNLVKALRDQGRSAVYIYGRTFPVVSRLLMTLGRATLLRGHDPWNHYEDYHSNKKRVMRAPWLKWVYTGAIWIDYYLQIWFKLLPWRFSNRTVVLDRYVYDTVINDLSVHLSYSVAQTDRAINRGLRWLPRPDVTFLIDLPPEVAFARKTDVPHIAYLTERSECYLRLASRPEVVRINGEETPDALLQAILSVVSGLMISSEKQPQAFIDT